jgi:hypothetical protein
VETCLTGLTSYKYAIGKERQLEDVAMKLVKYNEKDAARIVCSQNIYVVVILFSIAQTTDLQHR